MKEVRVSGMSRGAYEPPRLRVVAVADRMLLLYSTEAFKTESGPLGWGGYGAEAFGPDAVQSAWGGYGAEAFNPGAVQSAWGGYGAEAFGKIQGPWDEDATSP